MTDSRVYSCLYPVYAHDGPEEEGHEGNKDPEGYTISLSQLRARRNRASRLFVGGKYDVHNNHAREFRVGTQEVGRYHIEYNLSITSKDQDLNRPYHAPNPIVPAYSIARGLALLVSYHSLRDHFTIKCFASSDNWRYPGFSLGSNIAVCQARIH